jgi:DNA mismatch endonuclease, patch repair protein
VSIRSKRPLTRSEQMARIRSRNTHPELLLRRALWHLGYRYRVEFDLPGSPDLAFVREKLVIFVDGCFWHGCPVHYKPPSRNEEFWRVKLERNVSRDRRVDLELQQQGWAVLRLWEHEIVNSLDSTVTKIAALITAIRH